MRKLFFVASVMSIAVASATAAAWAAAPVISTDNGLSERSWAFRSKPGTDDIIFVWTPSLSIFDAEQYFLAECNRRDSLGVFVGNHRAVFKDISLLGVDTGNVVLLQQAAERIKDGLQLEQVVWLLTPAARALFAQDRSILVTGKVKVTKKVDPFDIVTCAFGALEILDVAGDHSAPVVEWQRDELLPVVRGVELPRLLKP